MLLVWGTERGGLIRCADTDVGVEGDGAYLATLALGTWPLFSCVSRVERMNLVHRAVVRTLDADSVAPGLRQVLLGPLSSRLSMLCLFDSFLCDLEIANISISSSFPAEGKLHSSLIRGTVMMSLPCTENILSTVLCLMHESYGSPLGFTADPWVGTLAIPIFQLRETEA